MKFERTALRAVGAAANAWNDWRYRIKLRLGLVSRPLLLPYRGYAANGRLRFGGRVVEDEGVVNAPPSLSRWTNLKRTFRRYETDEIRDARVEWRIGDARGTAVTDRDGYFHVDIALAPDALQAPWARVDMTLTGAPGYGFEPMEASTYVRVVEAEPEFGIISDLDDTLIETGAQNLLKHWRTVSLNSAEGRVAFPGVAYLFRALAAGRKGADTNPIFYVSSSPWNLYDLFETFMQLRDIPAGPMFLKDFGIDRTKWLTGSHRRHKLAAIERILASYPSLSFLLIGDTGQDDAVIYAEAVQRHRDRIVAVYLRDVTPSGFSPFVRRAMRRIQRHGVPLVACETLDTAALHAEEAGLVDAGTAGRMAEEVRGDLEKLEGWQWPRPFGLTRPADRESEEPSG
ncbi:App1 family protein [Aureimonas psammosilenae]|uniref:App1 family protein n=1 Tax=Aureimonas psammosilenae TaxID=2495496 RepID=UPI00186A8CD2|nr:phosphatase domain-containing protein [Aureimonas psammosilenae]